MNEDFCKNWPKWLRYLLTLPIALIVWWLAGAFLPHLFTLYFSRNSLGYELTQILVGGIMSTYLAQSILYTIPPKHKLWFVSIPSAFYIFILLVDFLYYFYYGAQWQTWLLLISMFVTCIATLCTLIKTELENTTIQKIEVSNIVKTNTEEEILSYIDKKASEMNMSSEEYIRRVKAYEEYQKNNKED